MSGRPVRRRVLADIETAGGWPAVLERIRNAESVAAIARSFQVSRSFFARLLHEDRGRHELVIQARKEAADALADEALEVARSAPSTAEELEAAKVRVDSSLRLAARLDPDRHGNRARAPTKINLAQLHLAAMRAPLPPAPRADEESAEPRVATRVGDR